MKLIFIHYAIVDKEGFGRTFKLAKEVALLNNQVVFITTQPFKEFKFPFKVEYRDNVKIISFPDILPDNFRRTGFGLFSTFLKVLYLIKHRKFDIVHSDTGHRPSAAIPALLLQLIFNVPHVTEWWDFFGKGGQFDEKSFFKKITFGFYDLLIQKPFLKISNGVIPLSAFLKDKALGYKIPLNKILLLNGGADIDGIKYHNNNEYLKIKYGIPKDSLTFGFIGMNSGEIKDLTPFLEALQKIKNEINVNWFTTGGLISGKIKHEFEIGDELKEFGWQDYDTFTECISCADVFLLLQNANIMNKARWPNKLGDYVAAGRLTLTNPVGEIVRVNVECSEIFNVVTFNTDDLTKKIRELYIDRRNLLSKGKIVREVAEKKLSWKNRATELVHFYSYILNKNKNNNDK